MCFSFIFSPKLETPYTSSNKRAQRGLRFSLCWLGLGTNERIILFILGGLIPKLNSALCDVKGPFGFWKGIAVLESLTFHKSFIKWRKEAHTGLSSPI